MKLSVWDETQLQQIDTHMHPAGTALISDWSLNSLMFTGRNEVVAKVMCLLEFVILFTGGWGCLPQCMLGYHPLPGADIPLRADTPPSRPPRADTPPEQIPTPRD